MKPIDADALKAYFFRPYSNEESYSNIDLEKIIDEQPTIEPERKKGKWNYIQAGMAVCPYCGARPHDDFKNFCANCGADMTEETSNEQ